MHQVVKSLPVFGWFPGEEEGVDPVLFTSPWEDHIYMLRVQGLSRHWDGRGTVVIEKAGEEDRTKLEIGNGREYSAKVINNVLALRKPPSFANGREIGFGVVEEGDFVKGVLLNDGVFSAVWCNYKGEERGYERVASRAMVNKEFGRVGRGRLLWNPVYIGRLSDSLRKNLLVPRLAL